ncbi:MAG: hypothetical protein H7Y38_19305 [Armatimonadetes bacterium]|nr:hypothetical protein [Armatimonadota bacterium]
MIAETEVERLIAAPRTVIAPYQKDDAEAQQIARDIDAVPLPPYVAEIRLRLDDDWLGNPGVFLYVIAEDEAFEKAKRISEVTVPVDHPLTQMLFAKANGRFPFISFRSVGEQRELDEEDAKPAKRRRR